MNISLLQNLKIKTCHDRSQIVCMWVRYFFHLLVDRSHVLGIKSTKLPANAVKFLEIIIVVNNRTK